MKTSSRHGNWMLTISLAALVGGFLFVCYFPGRRAVERLRGELERKEELVAQADGILPAMAVTEQELQKSRQYNARWVESAPSENELPGLYGRIALLAKTAGVATTRFDPQPPVQYERVRMVSVAAGFSGGFGPLCRFLDDLESLPQPLWIANLKMEGGSKSGKDVHCELTLAVFVDKSDESDQVKGSG